MDQFSLETSIVEFDFSYYCTHGFHRLTQIRMWQSSAGISGFQLVFEAITGISGWAPQTYFFGEPDLIDNYQKWDISEGHEIRSITAHADIDGNYLQYL